jgi:hypothetical protein
MKELLAVVSPAWDESLGSAARYALSLAGHMVAHVTILVAEIEPDIVPPTVKPDNMQGCGVAATRRRRPSVRPLRSSLLETRRSLRTQHARCSTVAAPRFAIR